MVISKAKFCAFQKNSDSMPSICDLARIILVCNAIHTCDVFFKTAFMSSSLIQGVFEILRKNLEKIFYKM